MTKRESALAKVESRVPGSFGNPGKKLNRTNTDVTPARSRGSVKKHTPDTKWEIPEINLYGP